jgi:hypothetical protein
VTLSNEVGTAPFIQYKCPLEVLVPTSFSSTLDRADFARPELCSIIAIISVYPIMKN